MELIERAVQARKYEEAVYGELRDHPINLDELFEAFVKTVRYHYVGFSDKERYFTPAEYHTYVFSHYRYQSLTYEMLVRSLHQFLGDLHDRRLRLYADDWIDYRNLAARYRVRASGEVLHVTEAEPQTGLVPGDRILKIQGLTPPAVRKLTRNNCFYSRTPERELWGGYLRMAKKLLVEHENGEQEIISIEPEGITEQSRLHEQAVTNYFRMTGDGKTAYMELRHLDTEQLGRLVFDHAQEIAGAEKLILDLRRCGGGEEGAGWELFPYLVDREYALSELMADEGSYVLCTKENCLLRLKQLENARNLMIRNRDFPSSENLTPDPEQLHLLDREIAFFRDNFGKGLVYSPAPPVEEEWIVPAEEAPESIVLLTDTFCEREGEQFAAMCKRCGRKVTVIGRPTMGTLDYYDNIDLQVHDHMVLSYPIRMTKAAHDGSGISEKGLPVDCYIPWTPEEIHTDVLLEKAMQVQ